MRVIFLGPPGAGKGTQAARLAVHFGVAHIATGDMLRLAVELETPIGLQVKPIMERGELVPDELTDALVRERIGQKDAEKGFILDGYPRNVAQATALDTALDEIGAKLDRVVRFMVIGTELVSRLGGRRVCPVCKTVYHADTHPPRVEGHCDNDGALLVQRPDDQEETILRRLEVYGEQTRPLFEFYREKDLLVDVDAMGTTEQVFDRLIEAVKVQP